MNEDFSWSPSFDQAGFYSVTFTATDAQGASDSETVTITVVDVPMLRVSVDLDLKPADQEELLVLGAVPGEIYAVQLYIVDGPEIDGWNIELAFDATRMRFFAGSSRVGDFLPGLEATAAVADGLLTITRNSSQSASGSGLQCILRVTGGF